MGTLYSKGDNEKTLSDHNVITFDLKNDFINREKNAKKKIKIMNRNYNKYDVNLALKNVTPKENENPLNYYIRYTDELKEQIEKLSKQIFVKEVKEYKVTKETIAYRKTLKKLRSEN